MPWSRMGSPPITIVSASVIAAVPDNVCAHAEAPQFVADAARFSPCPLRVVVSNEEPQTTAKAIIAASAAILAKPREPRLRLSWRGSLGRGRGFGLKNKERIVSVSSRSLAEEPVAWSGLLQIRSFPEPAHVRAKEEDRQR
jgi:hypothetical protein